VKSASWKFQTNAFCAALILGAAGLSARADQAPPPAAAPGTPATTVTTNAPTAATTNALASAAPAPSKDWSVTIGQDYFSEYVFRGVTVIKHNPIYAPSAVATWKNLTAYYYGYFGTGSDTVPGNKWYEEDDFAADVHVGLFNDQLTTTAGMYGYVYPDGKSGNDTYEFYGKLAWAGYLNPYAQLNWDVHTIHGGYGVVGINHAYDVTKFTNLKDGQALSITPSAQLGVDFGYNSRKTDSNINWNDLLFGLNIQYNITSAFSLHAMYQLSVSLNSASQAGTGNQSIFNLGATYAF
jgi:hypothetical protein